MNDAVKSRARRRWREDYRAQLPDEVARRNRSGLEVKPLYTPEDWDSSRYDQDLGYPGQAPTSRGIYPAMNRGRSWNRRHVVGLGLPEDFNARIRTLCQAGLNTLFIAPCPTHMRGYDADQVEPEQLGHCGVVINTSDDMASCLDGLAFDEMTLSLGDTAPYTLSAMMLKVARDRGLPWSSLTGTTNQSDYLSHFVALHMYFRLPLAAQRRMLLDHIEWMGSQVPRWNALSVVGQHMQQAGATPAEAMGLTLSSAIQYADDMVARGHQPDDFLPGFSFFFDISISFFEEVAKFRAGRRLWHRITGERFGARNPRARRFRFHGQTSGADLTRQQPLNNVARVAVQAMAGICGGLQSLHTDSYDEALSPPTEEAARIAVASQNILLSEAHLDDVIDPFGGSYYVESLTNQMEAEIAAVIARIDEAGGMFAAVESGLVQQIIGKSAQAFQERLERGEEVMVGVNAYQVAAADERPPPLPRTDEASIEAYLARLEAFKRDRDQAAVQRALDALARACHDEGVNLFGAVVEAVMAGASHGEVCARVRAELGFGQPLVAA
ncbi:MAG TPA: acyl-CoA mutase large subunit family protein [Alphaproteobacteria bacterium]|nr:acyl-CoA mutase large subunit family protein [Alphaproteobacteria bacterium]HJM48787.1 acyl-CoA mutase large subunit family protein [Alphaproteobacteria bacterium]